MVYAKSEPRTRAVKWTEAELVILKGDLLLWETRGLSTLPIYIFSFNIVQAIFATNLGAGELGEGDKTYHIKQSY